MYDFKKQEKQLKTEIEESEDEISVLEDELVKVKEDKLFYKRKEDYPAFDRALEKEILIVKKIKFLKNNIRLLEDKLIRLKNQETEYIKTKSMMDGVLKELYKGKVRSQACKHAGVSLSHVNRWYLDGKNRKDDISIYFYEKVKVCEAFYDDFFHMLRSEFKHQNQIHIYRYFIPKSYPQRLDRYYNDDSDLWFSRIELRNYNSLYYFGLKGDSVPGLMLLFDKDYRKSNFRLIDDELFLLLEFEDITKFKRDFRLLSVKSRDGWYYVGLGKLTRERVSDKLELLLKKGSRNYSNPFDVKKRANIP